MLNFESQISSLHQFDLFLCEYLAGTIGGWMRDAEVGPAFTRLVEAGLNDPQLQHHLADFHERLLLGDREMHAILTALDLPPRGLELQWIAWPSLHESYALTLREIGDVLGKATADDFAEKSIRIGRELEQEELPLHRGAECVVEWIEMVRGIKRAMGLERLLPRPEGAIPTPTDSEGVNEAAVGLSKMSTEDEAYAPYMPSSWFSDEFGISNDRLRSARRDGRLRFVIREKHFFYSVPHAMQLWPGDVTHLPDASTQSGG
jgi:hypothetical protein